MGRKVVERNLSTREARKSLAVRAEPYWRNEGEGQHIGYYKGARSAKWVARYRLPGSEGGYNKTTIGEADDQIGRDADGVRVFTWKQAKGQAALWFATMDAANGIKTGPYSVSDALKDYMTAFRGKDAVNTQRRIDVLIDPVLGRFDTARLTTDQIQQWHHSRAETPARLRTKKGSAVQNQKPLDTPEAIRRRRSTANRDLTVLKAALNFGYRQGRIASDHAWRRVKPFGNVERARERYLSDEEVRRLVNACDPDFRQMVQIALLTGMRYQEAAGARVAHFNEQTGTLRLYDTKADRARTCYLEAEGVGLCKAAALGKSNTDLLFPRPDGGQWAASQQARYLAKACTVGNVTPRATFHDLRRTYGARFATQGVPMAVIAEALGQADERITRRHYAHLAPSYVADTVRLSAAGLGIFKASDKVASLSVPKLGNIEDIGDARFGRSSKGRT